MKQYNVMILIAVICLSLMSCAKKPSKVVSPSVKLDVVTGEDKGKFALSAGLNNENSNVVFKKIKGTISIVNPAENKTLYSVPFSIEGILPFGTGKIIVEKEESRDQLMLIADLFSIKEKLENSGSATSNFLEESYVQLSDLNYEKEDIVDFLKSRMKKHEKMRKKINAAENDKNKDENKKDKK